MIFRSRHQIADITGPSAAVRTTIQDCTIWGYSFLLSIYIDNSGRPFVDLSPGLSESIEAICGTAAHTLVTGTKGTHAQDPVTDEAEPRIVLALRQATKVCESSGKALFHPYF